MFSDLVDACFSFFKSKNPVTLEENRTLNINTPMAWVMINFGVEVIVELRNSDLPHLTTLGVNTLFCPFQLFGELGIYEAGHSGIQTIPTTTMVLCFKTACL